MGCRSQEPEATSQKGERRHRFSSGYWLLATGFSPSLLRKMNPQHSVVVLRDDLLVEDVLWKLDFAAEGAVVDFHDVHAHAARGAVIALDLVATRDSTGALERHLAVVHDDVDLLLVDARQVHAHVVGLFGLVQVD